LIAGIVLSAGESSRMGSPKAFLELDGESFLARTVGALREGGCDPVIVVVGSPEDPAADRIAKAAISLGARTAVNPVRGSEQIDSLRRGLAAVTSTANDAELAAMVFTPVDSPDPPAEVVARLVEEIKRGAAIAIPTFGGRRGHPLAVAGRLIPELMSGDLPEGMRTILRRHDGEVVEVATESAWILLDVDTPEDYRRLVTDRS